MIGTRRCARLVPGLLAVLIVCLAPTVAAADTLVFRNELRASVVVHTSTVVSGRLFRNQPYLLRPGERTPVLPRRGDMTVTICDAAVANRILFQGSVRYSTTKLAFGICHSPVPGRIQVVRRPVVLPKGRN